MNRIVLAILAGILLAAGHPPWSLSLLSWLAPWAWLCLARRMTGWLAPASGYLAGAIGLGIGCWWISLTHPINLLLMVLAESVFYALLVWVLRRLDVHLRISPVLSLPLTFVAIEFARARVPLEGFPWLLLGYTQEARRSLIQVCDLCGVWGISFLMAMASGVFDTILRCRQGERRASDLIFSIAFLILLLGSVAYGAVRVRADWSGKPGPVFEIVQGNIPQQLKNEQRQDGGAEQARDILRRHLDLSKSALKKTGRPVDYLLWPETMLPYSLPTEPGSSHERNLLELVLKPEIFEPFATGLIAGVETYRGGAGAPVSHWNSVVVFDRTGRRLSTYHKAVLVPGGEYIPFLNLLPKGLRDWLMQSIKDLTGGYVPSLEHGAGAHVVSLPVGQGGVQSGISICFEVAHPAYVRDLVRDGAEILINFSNEGWFPGSAEFDQYSAMAIFRSIETRRALVRAANTGTSGWIDATGRAEFLVEKGRRHGFQGTMQVQPPLLRGTSLYVRWGDWLAKICVGMVAALLLRSFWPPLTKPRSN